ncbi:type II toxin-antitoxin system RelE/ParE family toxin [Candidatus Parcubacteria bacterium]|nr:type II toxin-antitoxin system RelE/ParE family toxin [Candidatus Parcubacteria bacterium]
MAAVRWLPEALDDIERLYTFLYDKSPEAAPQAANAILKAADLLQANPHIGRSMPDETGRRELFVAFGAGAYVLRYKLSGSDAIIIRVWHNRENRNK